MPAPNEHSNKKRPYCLRKCLMKNPSPQMSIFCSIRNLKILKQLYQQMWHVYTKYLVLCLIKVMNQHNLPQDRLLLP